MSDDLNDYTLSLDDLYRYLTDIDNLRSFVNITQSDNKTALKTLTQNISNIGDFLAKIKADNKPTGYQESRVSALCRYIGFPVISQNGQYFNPGYDKTKIDKSALYNIIANQDATANDFFDFREQYYNSQIKTIQGYSPINQNVFNLQMISTPEMFDVFKKNGSYKVYDSSACQYTLPTTDFLNQPFTSYRDASGNVPTLQKTNYHLIYPLVTDGRIELTLKPNARTTLVPFVRFDYNTIMNGTKLKRPMIESIIKKRFFVPAQINSNSYVQGNTQSNSNPSVSALLNDSYLSLSTNAQVVNLYNQLKNSTARYSDSEVISLSKYIYTLELLIDLWIENQKIIEETMSNYYWLPTCINNISPEFGVKSNPLFSNTLSTALDNQILQLNSRKDTLNLINNMSLDTVTADQYAFGQFDAVFSPDQFSGYKNILQQNVDNQMQHRTEQQQKAETALKNIEIICGGISGLGLIDIFVIISSLYLMDKNNLLGFLDVDAYSRAQDTSTNIVTLPSQTSLDDAYLDLETQIGQLYQFVSSTYNIKNNIS